MTDRPEAVAALDHFLESEPDKVTREWEAVKAYISDLESKPGRVIAGPHAPDPVKCSECWNDARESAPREAPRVRRDREGQQGGARRARGHEPVRVPGYCTSCRRIKQVRVSGHQLVMSQVRGGTAQGICADCEQKEEDRRRGVRR